MSVPVESLRFDGRSAIVTGAGRGLGRAYALELAARGARVVVADNGGNVDGGGASAAPADEVVAEIEAAGGEAVASYASVADEHAAASIIGTALDTFGRLDVVVNNAGISDPDHFEDQTIERFHKLMDVHFFGTLHVCKAAWPHLQGQGYGRIVNTTSEGMLGQIHQLSNYASAKAAVFGLTKVLAAEGPRHGIRVNGTAPRAITRMSYKTLPHVFGLDDDRLGQLAPTSRPEQAAPVVVYLAHESCELNGEVLCAGGGSFQRLFSSLSRGVKRKEMTPEDFAADLDRIMDPTDAPLVNVVTEELPLGAVGGDSSTR
jgi:NAD(P)-dependent dehydrogenase (short-subunit alcohol dehydrogenase family)